MNRKLFSIGLACLIALFLIPHFGHAQNTRPIVRLIYFLPNDRAPQPDIDAKLDIEIKDAQSLFADLLEKHGFERKTFRFETDASGNAVVHHLNGKFAAVHYHNSPGSVWEELTGQFNLTKNIYLISIDTGIRDPVTGSVCFRSSICGLGGWHNNGAGGQAIVPTNDNPAVAHELGHAFGLMHDYRYQLESLGKDPMLVSFCAAEWLDVNRYFNDFPPLPDAQTIIRMLPPLAAPSYAIRLRFEVNDSDGLHQAQLQILEKNRGRIISDYKSLNGESTTVEFVTPISDIIELIGGSTTTATKIWLQVTDVRGNFTVQEFPIDIAPLLPHSEVVSVPDANLAAAIRRELGISPEDAITQLDMLGLKSFYEGIRSKIIDLTGLEHAIYLKDLIIHSNQINDLRPLAGLTRLTRLSIANNQIGDITPLAGLTQLRTLYLGSNQIGDITPLAGLTQLRTLYLGSNQIGDITPLAGLTQLRMLYIENNQINDMSSLTNFVNLESVYVWGNSIITIPPKAQVDFSLLSDKVTLIESGKFIVYSSTDRTILDSTDPVTVKTLDFNRLLHWDNLTGFFDRGGTIELVAGGNVKFGDVVISEIMWGLHESSPDNQWFELYNTTSNDINLGSGSWGFRFRYGTAGTEWHPWGWKVIDRVSNIGWEVPGQSGNTSQNQPLISMYRDINYEIGSVPDGTLASSWKASTGRVNLLPPSYGTPGAKHLSPSSVATEASRFAADVNGDGTVNIQDLVQVAANFGATGENPADVNGDGDVNIQDLVQVAAAFGETAAAPAAQNAAIEHLTATEVKQWLHAAQNENLTDPDFQRGVEVLKHLLSLLTPKETVLLANYPNPFNPETWIPYQLAEPAEVTLRIYTIDGSLVRVLSLGHKATGSYQNRTRAAYWDGRNNFGEPVASGVYFYTLSTESTHDSGTAGDFTATRKMLIRK